MLHVLVSRICNARMGASVLQIRGLSGEYITSYFFFLSKGGLYELLVWMKRIPANFLM